MTTEKALVLIVPAFLICSALIVALTEALKKAFGWSGTITSSAVSLLVPVAVTAAYCILTGTAINAVLCVFLVFLIFVSWIGATLGFDKAKELVDKIMTVIGANNIPTAKDYEPEKSDVTVGEEKGNPDEEDPDEKK